MKYQAPFGSSDPNAPYVDRNTPAAISGSRVPAAAIEHPQREIVQVLLDRGLVPSETDVGQLSKAISFDLGGVDRTVLDWQSAPPASPAEGSRYIVKPTASGAWAGQNEKLALFAGGVWKFLAPVRGMQANYTTGDQYRVIFFDGITWKTWIAEQDSRGPVSLAEIDARIAARSGAFGACYLDVIGGVMTLSPESGTAILINGAYRDLPGSGVTKATASLSNTLLYVYASWNGTTIVLEDSATAPVADSTYGHLVKSGDPTRTYVGLAQSGNANAWQAGLLVASRYNKKEKSQTEKRATPVTRSSITPGDVDSTLNIPFVSDDEVVQAFAAASIKSDSVGSRSVFQVAINTTDTGTYQRNQNVDYTPVTSFYRKRVQRGYHVAAGKHAGEGAGVITDNYEITVSKQG